MSQCCEVWKVFQTPVSGESESITQSISSTSHKATAPDVVECRESDVVFDEDCEVFRCLQQSRPVLGRIQTIMLSHSNAALKMLEVTILLIFFSVCQRVTNNHKCYKRRFLPHRFCLGFNRTPCRNFTGFFYDIKLHTWTGLNPCREENSPGNNSEFPKQFMRCQQCQLQSNLSFSRELVRDCAAGRCCSFSTSMINSSTNRGTRCSRIL